MFKIPSGNASTKFVNLLAEWIQHFNTESELKGIALKVFHILPALLLQKPSKNSKAKDHLRCLEKRLAMWEAGDVSSLLAEARVIQARFKKAARSARRTDCGQRRPSANEFRQRLHSKWVKHRVFSLYAPASL